MALTFGLGPQHAYSKSGKSKVDQRWCFDVALNYNLPTGKLDYPATFNPEFNSTTTMVGGGFSFKPSLSYSLRVGYDRSFTKNGVHGFVIALGLTDYKTFMQFHEYSFYYHGFLYTQHTDRYVFDEVSTELRLSYRFRKDRTSIELGALGLIRSDRIFREYLLDGTHGRSRNADWRRFQRWMPIIQVNYRFLTKNRLRFDGFISSDKRLGPENETHWWDIQAGIRVSLVKELKRKR
ncbi:MAG: hypothetical protein JST66_01875 [Bacteroidetes bacterium]|nr:hypothetical protein [Bacteroidota bacterium]